MNALGAVDSGPVQEVTQHYDDWGTFPTGIMQWQCSLLSSWQFHFAVHYIS